MATIACFGKSCLENRDLGDQLADKYSRDLNNGLVRYSGGYTLSAI